MGFKILVVEDVDSLREVLTSVLESEGFEVDAVPDAERGLVLVRAVQYACILSDFRLPGQSGIDLLRETRTLHPSVPFLLMTAFGSIDIAVEAMKLGANDFLCKPFEPARLCETIHQVIQHRRIIDRSFGLRTRRDRQFLTKDPKVERMLAQARKVGAVASSCLVLGESGTGKELIARYIHEHSTRKEKPFVAVNCAALPADLLESEFFGHEAGAFTGATQSRIGIFEYASEGTIFLDEIGDMPLNLQVKLLRALQEREIKRVGGLRSIKVDPRIIAATNHDVDRALEAGTLREDFYYRLAVVTFTLSPLRERTGDVELLVRNYLDHFCMHLGKSLTISEESWKLLLAYRWPGNARELENVMERAVVMADDVIEPDHLGIDLGLDFEALSQIGRTLPELAEVAARKAEVDAIRRVLDQTKGNKSKAAQILGVSYKTLLNKVREYALDPSAARQSVAH